MSVSRLSIRSLSTLESCSFMLCREFLIKNAHSRVVAEAGAVEVKLGICCSADKLSRQTPDVWKFQIRDSFSLPMSDSNMKLMTVDQFHMESAFKRARNMGVKYSNDIYSHNLLKSCHVITTRDTSCRLNRIEITISKFCFAQCPQNPPQSHL